MRIFAVEFNRHHACVGGCRERAVSIDVVVPTGELVMLVASVDYRCWLGMSANDVWGTATLLSRQRASIGCLLMLVKLHFEREAGESFIVTVVCIRHVTLAWMRASSGVTIGAAFLLIADGGIICNESFMTRSSAGSEATLCGVKRIVFTSSKIFRLVRRDSRCSSRKGVP